MEGLPHDADADHQHCSGDVCTLDCTGKEWDMALTSTERDAGEIFALSEVRLLYCILVGSQTGILVESLAGLL